MPKSISMQYTFKFAKDKPLTFAVELDAETLALQSGRVENLPDWTKLDFQKCPTCPLNPADHPHCPAAVGVSNVVEGVRDHVSYEEVEATVMTEGRTYSKKTTLEEALVSLMALHMTTSGCPTLDKLRPMAELQLPFPTPAESSLQFLLIALAGKYFAQKATRPPPPDFVAELKEAQIVNTAFFKRLTAIGAKDGARNSVVILNNLIFMASRAIEQNKFPHFEQILQRK
jgi:hypothetical protein